MPKSKAETPALIALGALSLATNVMIPILVDTLIDALGMSRIDAGWIISSEFSGALAGSILVLVLIRKVSRRTLAFLAIPFWTACNAASSIYPAQDVLLLLRAGSGLGMGITVAITMGAIASRPNPVRLFAGLLVAVPLFLMVAIPAIQMTATNWGIQGAYCFLGAMAASGILFANRLPNDLPETDAESRPQSARSVILSMPVACLILASLVLFTGFNGTWAYVSQAGRSIGVAPQAIALTIGIAQLASIAGSFLAGLVNERLGHALPLVFGLALSIIGSLLLAGAGTGTTFSLSLVPFLFGWLMSQPFVIGASAKLDRSGTVATAISVAQNMGTAIGPYLAGLAIEGRPAETIGLFSAALFGAGLALATPAALRASKNEG